MKRLVAKRRNRPRTSNSLSLQTRHRSSLSVTSNRWWLPFSVPNPTVVLRLRELFSKARITLLWPEKLYGL